DAITLCHAQRHKRARAAVDLHLKLAVGVPDALVAHNQRLVVGVARDRLVEYIADGHAQQWGVAAATCVAHGMFHNRSPYNCKLQIADSRLKAAGRILFAISTTLYTCAI